MIALLDITILKVVLKAVFLKAVPMGYYSCFLVTASRKKVSRNNIKKEKQEQDTLPHLKHELRYNANGERGPAALTPPSFTPPPPALYF